MRTCSGNEPAQARKGIKKTAKQRIRKDPHEEWETSPTEARETVQADQENQPAGMAFGTILVPNSGTSFGPRGMRKLDQAGQFWFQFLKPKWFQILEPILSPEVQENPAHGIRFWFQFLEPKWFQKLEPVLGPAIIILIAGRENGPKNWNQNGSKNWNQN